MFLRSIVEFGDSLPWAIAEFLDFSSGHTDETLFLKLYINKFCHIYKRPNDEIFHLFSRNRLLNFLITGPTDKLRSISPWPNDKIYNFFSTDQFCKIFLLLISNLMGFLLQAIVKRVFFSYRSTNFAFFPVTD